MNTQTELKRCFSVMKSEDGIETCGKMLPVSMFHFRSRKTGVRQNQCNDCRNAKDLKARAIAVEIKKSFIRRIEEKAQCIVKGCSARSNYKIDWAHFDHIEPVTKVDDVSRMVSSKEGRATLDDVLNEIHKCNIVCSVHHQWNTKTQQFLNSIRLKWAEEVKGFTYYTISEDTLNLIQELGWAYSLLRKKQNDRIVLQAYQETLEKYDVSKVSRWT